MADQAGTLHEVIQGALGDLGLRGERQTLEEQIGTLAHQLGNLQSVNQAVADSVKENTLAVNSNTWTRGGDGESKGSSAAKTVLGAIGTGIGLSPLVTGIAKLFGGGGSAAQTPALVRYALPQAVAVQGGVSVAAPDAFAVEPMQGQVSRPVVTQAAGPQIQVNVRAMDSRSFLDHSADIALAVRQAMLESSVLNDVIREA